MDPYLPPASPPEPDRTRPDFRAIGHGAQKKALFAGVMQILSGGMLVFLGRYSPLFKWSLFIFFSGILGVVFQLAGPFSFRRKFQGEPLVRSGEAIGAGMTSRITGSGWIQGILFLTETELVFVPRRKAHFEEEARFQLPEIVGRLRHGGNFLRPKLIFESNGEEITFVMVRPRAWQKAISNAARAAGAKFFA